MRSSVVKKSLHYFIKLFTFVSLIHLVKKNLLKFLLISKMFNFLKFLIVFIQLQYILNQKFLSHEKCGIPYDSKTMGWMTYIVLYDKTDIKCIANFITEEWLISTASCLRNYKNASYYKIKLPETSALLEIDKVMDRNFYHNSIKLIIL
jgi:hypothetical protein